MRVIIGVIGFLAGVAAGALLVLFNPLGQLDRVPSLDGDAVATKRFEEGAYRGMEIALGPMLGLANPNQGQGFREQSIGYSRASLVRLQGDGDLQAALAVKLSSYSTENSLLRGRLGMISLWNIVWPGEGSVFMLGQENFLPLLSEARLSALKGDGYSVRDERYPLTTRWSSTDYQGIIGASGQYAEAGGQFREWVVPVDGRADQLEGLLEIQMHSD